MKEKSKDLNNKHVSRLKDRDSIQKANRSRDDSCSSIRSVSVVNCDLENSRQMDFESDCDTDNESGLQNSGNKNKKNSKYPSVYPLYEQILGTSSYRCLTCKNADQETVYILFLKY